MKVKSFIAALVSAAVILESCPFVSLADTEPEEIETEVPEEFDLPDDGVLDSGWYYVSSDWSYDTILTVSGTVNLILTNGNTLSCQGINVPSGSTLNFYGQRNDGGSLITAGTADSNNAGIGGISVNKKSSCGTVNIYGGHIEATGNGYVFY